MQQSDQSAEKSEEGLDAWLLDDPHGRRRRMLELAHRTLPTFVAAVSTIGASAGVVLTTPQVEALAQLLSAQPHPAPQLLGSVVGMASSAGQALTPLAQGCLQSPLLVAAGCLAVNTASDALAQTPVGQVLLQDIRIVVAATTIDPSGAVLRGLMERQDRLMAEAQTQRLYEAEGDQRTR